MGIGWALEFSVGCWCVLYFWEPGLTIPWRVSQDQLWSSEMKPSVPSVALLLPTELFFSLLLMLLVDGDSAHLIQVASFREYGYCAAGNRKDPPFHGHFSTPWAALATSSCIGPADLMPWSRTKLLKTNVFRWIRQHGCVPSEETWEGKGYVNKLVFKK